MATGREASAGSSYHQPQRSPDTPVVLLELEDERGGKGCEVDEDTNYEGLIHGRFWDVLRGSTVSLPSMPTNTVRIFLSSTFSDFKAERNMLPQMAYPQLEHFCSQLDLDFQVVDMRWGVTDEVINDHQVMPLCIAEIQMCQQVSCGPNFVVLLGDRYGWQGFPPCIPCDEFDVLLDQARLLPDESDTQILNEWFVRDDNAVPAAYILQPIHSRLHHYHDRSVENREKRDADRRMWDTIFVKLQKVLRLCAKGARENGVLTVDQEHKYFRSGGAEEV